MRWKVYQRPTVFDNHRHYFITRNRCHGGKLAALRHFQSYLSSVFVPADWMSLSSPRHLNWKRSWVWVISLKIHRYMIHDDIWWSAGISSWPVKNRVTHFLICCSVRRFVRECIWFQDPHFTAWHNLACMTRQNLLVRCWLHHKAEGTQSAKRPSHTVGQSRQTLS